MDDQMENRLREWLEVSGRSLELRAARALQAAGAGVQPSFKYADPTSGQERESDVLAKFGWLGPQRLSCSITAVVECKSSKKYPWVAFYDHFFDRARSLNSWFTFAHGPFTAVTDPLLELWDGRPPFDEARVATHAAAAFSKDYDPIHDTLRQVLSAAAAVRDDYIRHQVERRRGLVVMPVVVVEAPIVRCFLNKGGAVSLEETDLVHIWVRGLSGSRQRIYVLNESRLPTFAKALAELADIATAAQSAT